MGKAAKIETLQDLRNSYLLQNVGAGCVGNSPVFWATKGGYTQWIDQARIWTKEEAENKIMSTRGSHSWQMWSVEEIEACAKRTVDMQDLVRLVSSAEGIDKQ